MSNTVFTVGHSSRSTADLVAVLRAFGVSAIADVRSQPYSRLHPQFCREPLARELKRSGVAYVFLGSELGARPDDHTIYVNGTVSFERLSASSYFKSGLARVLKGSERYRIALLCAERDPLGCHRAILVARHLAVRGATIQHILDANMLESHEALEARLLRTLGLPDADMFRSREELVADGYRSQESRIAYRTPDAKGEGPGAREEGEAQES